MQEKIANLEIKVVYDSAITKKGRELSKPQCEQGPTDGTARARGGAASGWARKSGPPPPPWNHEWQWLRGHRAALLVLLKWNFARGHPHNMGECRTALVSIPRRPVSAEGRGTSPRLSSSPGMWAAHVLPLLRSGSTRRPLKAPLPRPPRWGGGPQRAWRPEGPHGCQRQRCAVPLVPTRGPLAAASMGRTGTPLCNQDTAPRLPASLGQTLPPSWVVLPPPWLFWQQTSLSRGSVHTPPTTSAAPKS